jgi:hypothetical protein
MAYVISEPCIGVQDPACTAIEITIRPYRAKDTGVSRICIILDLVSVADRYTTEWQYMRERETRTRDLWRDFNQSSDGFTAALKCNCFSRGSE